MAGKPTKKKAEGANGKAQGKAPASPAKAPVQLTLTWSSADQIDLVHVDHLHLARVKDQFYLTFGQVRMPVDTSGPLTGEIRPAARLVLTREALARMVGLLNANVERKDEKE